MSQQKISQTNHRNHDGIQSSRPAPRHSPRHSPRPERRGGDSLHEENCKDLGETGHSELNQEGPSLERVSQTPRDQLIVQRLNNHPRSAPSSNCDTPCPPSYRITSPQSSSVTTCRSHRSSSSSSACSSNSEGLSTVIDLSGVAAPPSVCGCPDAVFRCPAGAIASVETLTPSSTPRSFTMSSATTPGGVGVGEATIPPVSSPRRPPHEWLPYIDVYCDDKALVRRSWSLVESSSALAPHSPNAKKYRHKKSPSHGGTPFHACPLDDPCQGLRIQLTSLEIEAGLHHCCSYSPPIREKGGSMHPSKGSLHNSEGDELGSDREVESHKKWPLSFSSGIGEPSVYHALVVIFLEFFAWGLLTSPMILVLKETFPDHTFLMNGIIMGIKGILSFLSAPLVGALSDVWGRKFFLFITVFFTCLPIPFMKINTWWYFALISMSGVFAVTYSIVFAYVADVTDPAERHHAYGLVSATFAASLVTSPALGAYLSQVHSDDLVVGLATAISVLDIFFILVAVPESLPEKLRLQSTWSTTQISWEQADPFSTLWKVSKDRHILLISITVFLSYLPEAGQMSCFFVYLQLVMGFGPEMVATFIAVVGILSVIAQTALLGLLIKSFSNKTVIIIGLVFELLQLMWYGFGSQTWMMWAAGVLAAVSSITYPAISSYVSTHTDVDKQGVAQGIVTGMRGLCAGLGPAVFGFIFYLFHVDLNQDKDKEQNTALPVPGPPFVFGAMLVLLALTVSAFIPEASASKSRKQSVNAAIDMGYSRDRKKSDSDGTSQPLMNETGVL